MSAPVFISAYNRYHSFQLAQYLEDRGRLGGICTWDWREPRGVPKSIAFRGTLSKRVACKVVQRTPFVRRFEKTCWRAFDHYAAVRFGPRAAKEMGNSVFHVWSGFCRETIAAAHRSGARVFLERSCPHISIQREILAEEDSRWGFNTAAEMRAYLGNETRMIEEYQRADFIVTPSEFSAQSFIRKGYSPDKIKICRLGANFDPSVNPVMRDSSGTFTVLSVGTHAVRKGFIYLLAAWRKAALPNSRLLIRGPFNKRFKEWLGDNIEFLPSTDHKGLQRLYCQANLFCLPSVEEGFGMVVLEAMANGCAVLISDAVGSGEIIKEGKNGFKFPSRDIETLAQRLTALYEQRSLLAPIREAAKETAREFSWERYGDEMLSIYGK